MTEKIKIYKAVWVKSKSGKCEPAILTALIDRKDIRPVPLDTTTDAMIVLSIRSLKTGRKHQKALPWYPYWGNSSFDKSLGRPRSLRPFSDPMPFRTYKVGRRYVSSGEQSIFFVKSVDAAKSYFWANKL
jgi:hypothetical protein